MKQSRISVAQRVVATARRLNQEQGNVQDLPTTRLERGVVDGKSNLVAVFPMKGGGEPQRLDISFLLDFPLLADLFAGAVLNWGKPLDPKTRKVYCETLKRYWFSYLKERRLYDIAPEKLDEQVMGGFKSWLHQKRQKNGQPLHPNTIGRALAYLRKVLSNALGAEVLADYVPAGPRGGARKSEPTEVLRFEQLLQVMNAAEKEVLALSDRWDEGRHLLKLGHELLRQGAELEVNPGRTKKKNLKSLSEPNVALALAMVDQRYPGVIPNLADVKSHDARLWGTIQYVLGMPRLTGYFYAASRDLVPLALCIGIATVFNAETLLKLRWKSINRDAERLGDRAVEFDVRGDDEEGLEELDSDDHAETKLVEIIGHKPRAKRQLVRLLDPESSGPTQVSLNLILDLLTALTARIRPHVVAPEYSDCVFLFVQMSAVKRAKGFGTSTQSGSSDATWTHALHDFIDKHKLPHFNLKILRATLLDHVQLFNRGDLAAAQQVGNHRSRLTTWTHYTSKLIRRLLQEATGETLLVRERWLESAGRIDPRRYLESTNKGCATPGWVCLDPYESPRPNQRQGRLCTAYGECPDCPLAAARPDNPRNVMLYEALRRAIYRSVPSVTVPVWQQRWAPVVVALDELMESVRPDVLERSRSLYIEVPDVG